MIFLAGNSKGPGSGPKSLQSSSTQKPISLLSLLNMSAAIIYNHLLCLTKRPSSASSMVMTVLLGVMELRWVIVGQLVGSPYS